jgi:hypothetical protein
MTVIVSHSSPVRQPFFVAAEAALTLSPAGSVVSPASSGAGRKGSIPVCMSNGRKSR